MAWLKRLLLLWRVWRFNQAKKRFLRWCKRAELLEEKIKGIKAVATHVSQAEPMAPPGVLADVFWRYGELDADYKRAALMR